MIHISIKMFLSTLTTCKSNYKMKQFSVCHIYYKCKIHFVSGSIQLRGYNVHTNKSKENTFCVRLNPAPRLQYNIQYTKQMKMKYMFKIYYLVTIMEHARIFVKGKGKYILHLAQSGSEVTIQYTIYKANENEIHVKRNVQIKLQYTPSDHPCKLRVPLEVPVLFPPYMSCELCIPRLDCNTSCMDGQKVGILHDCHQIVLCSLMQGLHCTSCPLEWTFVDPSPCQLFVGEVGGIPS